MSICRSGASLADADCAFNACQHCIAHSLGKRVFANIDGLMHPQKTTNSGNRLNRIRVTCRSEKSSPFFPCLCCSPISSSFRSSEVVMFSRRFQVLMLIIAVGPMCGCSFSSRGLGSFAAHGPCKTLGLDVRPGQGAPGPDICLHDRCLGWMVARNKGPFYHLMQGTTDPGCGNGNCRSLVGGSHTIVEQFPGANGSSNPVINQTAFGVGGPVGAASPTPAIAPTQAVAATTTPVTRQRSVASRRPTSSKPANRLAQQRFDPFR